jgi:hypothetical protein
LSLWKEQEGKETPRASINSGLHPMLLGLCGGCADSGEFTGVSAFANRALA